MLGQDIIAKSVSGKLKKSTKYLYSGEGNTITDEEFEKIEKILDEVNNYNSFYVDTVGTVEEVRDTILNFVNERDLINKKRGLVVTLDHVLLTKGKAGETEKKVVDSMYHMLVGLKKMLTARGLKVLFIILSQLNRSIESAERTQNPNLHYPAKNDIFGASSAYYSSDYVLITHKPVGVDGWSSQWYGPPRKGYPYGLPVWNPEKPGQAMIYWHLIKERFGRPKLLTMVENFKESKVEEY